MNKQSVLIVKCNHQSFLRVADSLNQQDAFVSIPRETMWISADSIASDETLNEIFEFMKIIFNIGLNELGT